MSKAIYLVVTPFFPSPDHWQGPFVLDQVKAIQRNSNFEIVVFKPCSIKEKKPSYEFDGIKVHHVPSFFMPSYLFNGFGGEINGRNLKKKIKELGIEFDDIKVVHVHTAAFACYASAMKKACPQTKTILQYHDPDPYQIRNGKWSTWRLNAIYRARKLISQFKYIDIHLCISEKVRYNLIHFPIPHPDESYGSYINVLKSVKSIKTPKSLNTYILYNGVDSRKFYNIEGLKDNSIFHIGCIANFVDWKDQITLIKAVEILIKDRRFSNIRVSFIGSGVTKRCCQKYVEEHGLQKNFIFKSEMHHSELVKFYNTLDLFVLPSYFEGFGCVFTEAFACGVPFIGVYDQGAAEMICPEERERWLIKPHDHEQLAILIRKQILNKCKQHLNRTYDIDECIIEFLSNCCSLD